MDFLEITVKTSILYHDNLELTSFEETLRVDFHLADIS